VTHAQEEALVMSDLIAIIHQGKLAQLGSPEEIYERPRSRFVADFIGLSDFLPARVESYDATMARVAVAGATLTVPATLGLSRDQTILLHIRPYDIEFVGESAQENVLPGVIKQATYLGNIMDYRVEVGQGIALRVQASTDQRRAAGERVRLHFPASKCHLIAE
jgi:spermidine/putrescine transport system ATP-binding protein